ncbi:hypothetical protein Tco_0950028 [Tanacetum coccineum]
MFQEMMQQQYELDRKAKMDVIERGQTRELFIQFSKDSEDMRVLQIDARGMDPVDAAIINTQKARVRALPTASHFLVPRDAAQNVVPKEFWCHRGVYRRCNTPKSGLQRNVEYPRALLHSSIAQDMRTTTKRVV